MQSRHCPVSLLGNRRLSLPATSSAAVSRDPQQSHASSSSSGPIAWERKLGQGGMGAVYAGRRHRDRRTGRGQSALARGWRSTRAFASDFEAEIESLKKLRHPNIVRLFGYGEQAGTLFYAMELVDGHSLEDELRDGRRFEWREVTQIAIKLCRALKHAHDHGVIHRDLKPANLLLTPDGRHQAFGFRHRPAVWQHAADGRWRRAGHGRVHGSRTSRRPAGDRPLRSVQPGRRDVRAAGRAAAVSRQIAGRDAATAALCRARAGHALCSANAGRAWRGSSINCSKKIRRSGSPTR